MNNNDKTAFSAAMVTMRNLFAPKIDDWDSQVKTYWLALSPVLTIEQFSEAANKAITRGKFFPRPAELVEHAIDFDAKTREAWHVLTKIATGMKTQAKSIELEDTVLAHAITEMGGWKHVSMGHYTATEWNTWERKRFEELYPRLLRDHVEGRLGPPPKMVGYHDSNRNTYNPVFIGINGRVETSQPKIAAPRDQLIESVTEARKLVSQHKQSEPNGEKN